MIDPVESFETKFDIFELLDRTKYEFQSMILCLRTGVIYVHFLTN